MLFRESHPGSYCENREMEKRRRKVILRFFTIMASIVFLAFLVEAVVCSDTAISIALILFFVATNLNMLLASRKKEWASGLKRTTIIVGPMAIFLLYGSDSIFPGILWCYLFPPVAFFTLGFRKGIISTALFFTGALFVLFIHPENAVDPVTGKIYFQFITSFLALTTMVMVYEYSTSYFRKHLIRLYFDLDKMARTDELTGLLNRREMQSRFEYEEKRSMRTGEKFAIVMADIDYFKQVNDNYGHNAGDYVLREVSNIMRRMVRRSDVVARWGGEEFILLLPRTGLRGARIVSEKIRREIEIHKFLYEGKDMSVTMSLGMEVYEGEASIDDTIKLADQFLYIAKQRGRNRVVDKETSEETMLSDEIRELLEKL